jgi:hypothetical protein
MVNFSLNFIESSTVGAELAPPNFGQCKHCPYEKSRSASIFLTPVRPQTTRGEGETTGGKVVLIHPCQRELIRKMAGDAMPIR